jgi:hypothetical protein
MSLGWGVAETICAAAALSMGRRVSGRFGMAAAALLRDCRDKLEAHGVASGLAARFWFKANLARGVMSAFLFELFTTQKWLILSLGRGNFVKDGRPFFSL